MKGTLWYLHQFLYLLSSDGMLCDGNPSSHNFETTKTLDYPWETEKVTSNIFATWFCCPFIFFLNTNKSNQTAALGVLGTPGYRMPCAG